MAQSMINFRMDSDTKHELEEVCESMGMSISTAFNIFAKRVIGDRKIPFEVTATDPFYSKSNLDYLAKQYYDYENGSLKFEQHDLIEE